MDSIGRLFILIGGLILLIGVILMFTEKVPFLGKLPGDIHWKKEGYQIFIPMTSSILLSLVVTLILWLVSHVGKK
jgi:hypothetical protein